MSWYLCYLCGGTFLLPLSWMRTNKNDSFDGDADDLMCYAGCASNLIAWLHGEWSKDGAAEIDFRALFESGACISLAICADSTALSHGITLWGVEYENGVLTKLWLTDFDDAWVSSDPRLFSATVSVAENGKIYITGTENDLEDWYFYGSHDVYIDSVYALNAAASANWKLVPEPATASLSLVALAVFAARRRRK